MDLRALLRSAVIGAVTILSEFVKISHEEDSSDKTSRPIDRSEVFEEERLRYVRDSIERIYSRRVAVVDGLNYTLVAVIGFLIALLCVFVDKMCDFGWLTMAWSAMLVIVTVWGMVLGPRELDADEFVSDSADDAFNALVSNTETILDEIRFVNLLLAKKRFRTVATGLGSALLIIYIFLVKAALLPPLRISHEYCPTAIVSLTKGSSTGIPNPGVKRFR